MRRVTRFVNLERTALRKLKQLDLARRIEDLSHRRLTGSSDSRVIVRGNGACGLMISFVFAFAGRVRMLKMLRSWTIIEAN
jgi:hypothetical protein